MGAYEPSEDNKYDEGSPTTGHDFFSKLTVEWEKAAHVDPPVRLVSIYQNNITIIIEQVGLAMSDYINPNYNIINAKNFSTGTDETHRLITSKHVNNPKQ